MSDVITGDSLPRMIRMEEAYSSASTPISSSVQLLFLCFLSVILGLIADDVSNESNQHACVASVVKIFSYLFLKSSSRKLRLNLRLSLRLRSKIRPLVNALYAHVNSDVKYTFTSTSTTKFATFSKTRSCLASPDVNH